MATLLKTMYQITTICCETKEKTRGCLHENEDDAKTHVEYLRNNFSYSSDDNNHYDFGYETVYVNEKDIRK